MAQVLAEMPCATSFELGARSIGTKPRNERVPGAGGRLGPASEIVTRDSLREPAEGSCTAIDNKEDPP